MNPTTRCWGYLNEVDTPLDHLLALLASTEAAYKNQTDWFLGHKESGIRRLGVLIASEITVTGFYLRDQELYPQWLVVAVLLSMVLIAIALALSTLHSCTRSYLAAMEQGMLKNKVVWALGLSGPVILPNDQKGRAPCPAPGDSGLYVPRYVRSGAKDLTTQLLLERIILVTFKKRQHHDSEGGPMEKGWTTYDEARFTILLFGGLGVAAGVVSAAAIYCS